MREEVVEACREVGSLKGISAISEAGAMPRYTPVLNDALGE